ncbi:hypothetical protein BSKO_04029 [Bryopsis sp. KO-2023]|nr:hypothetical protein BSKO_04029 [Bryopsis sp. KO-2023]
MMKRTSRPPTPSSRGAFKKAGSCSDVGANTPFIKGQLRHAVDGSRGPVKGGSGGIGGPVSFHLPLNGTSFDEKDRRNLESPGSSGGVNVKVLIRVRPPSTNELALEDAIGSVTITSGQTIDLALEGKAEPCQFTFDNVYDESTTQIMVFEGAGVPLVENCLNGFNSTIFCYGQTGAGKTHTMIGELEDNDKMGLAPRVFARLFERIQEETEKNETTTFAVDCSFLEIHNETITDLLNPNMTNMLIREGTTGAYVDGLKAVKTVNGTDALELMKTGTQNRKVTETKANKQSSRSHMVYTCFVEKKSQTEQGLERKTYSRLNLVDLAGSERNRASKATSDTLKEACHINKSLSTLGRVIKELVQNQRSGHGHIPYRDSKLTYLLQDSLGGNAKTSIIANISPMSPNVQETLSTLQFVKRAKNIRQKCKVNEATNAGNEILQKEIRRLKHELENARMQQVQQVHSVEPMSTEETDSLKEKLREEVMKMEDLQDRMEATQSSNRTLKEQAHRFQQKIQDLTDDKEALREDLNSLLEQCDEVSARCGDVDALKEKASSSEMQAVLSELESEKEKAMQTELTNQENAARIEDLLSQISQKTQELNSYQEKQQSILSELEASQSKILSYEDEITSLTKELKDIQASHDKLAAVEADLTGELASTKKCLEDREDDLKNTQSALEAAQAQGEQINQETARLREELHSYQKNLEDAERSRDFALETIQRGEARIEELTHQLGAQHTELKGSQEAVLKVERGAMDKEREKAELREQLAALQLELKVSQESALKWEEGSAEKDKELAELKEQLAVLQIELEKRNDDYEKLSADNMRLETENAEYLNQLNEVEKQKMELQDTVRALSQEIDEGQDIIDHHIRRFHEEHERVSIAEDGYQRVTGQLQRMIAFTFKYTAYFDNAGKLLDDFEDDCPTFVAKKLEEHEKECECDLRSTKRKLSKKSSKLDRSYRTGMTSPASMRYGVIPGGIAAYADMPSQMQRVMSRNGSMSAREVWTTGYSIA